MLFLQQIINGISIGGVYALLATGYALIYSVLGFSNWAHGEVAMIGGYIAFLSFTAGRLPFVICLILAIIGAGCVSVLNERLAYRKIRNNKAPTMFLMIAAMGLSISYQNLVVVTLGPKFKVFPPVFPVRSVRIGDLSLGMIDVVSLLITVVILVAIEYLVNRTKFGLGVRASASNMGTASLLGIDVTKYIVLVFLLAGALSGMAGVLLGLKYNIYPQMGNISTKAFVASVFGGLGSLKGAIVGAVCVGLMETLVTAYISAGLRDMFTFGLLILILVLKPSGLFGKTIEDKA